MVLKLKRIMKEIILKKLGLTERGAYNILADKLLCERIINEDISEIKEASAKFNIPLSSLTHAVKQRTISCIANAGLKKGCKRYVFDDELTYTYKNKWHTTSLLSIVKSLYSVIDALAIEVLTTDKYDIFKQHNEGGTFNEISKTTGHTSQYAQLKYSKSITILKTYARRQKKYEDLKSKNIELEYENIFLKKKNLALKDKIKKANYINNVDFLAIELCEFNISFRLLNFLKGIEIIIVDDLISKIKSFDKISDFMKYRNIGRKTYKEIIKLTEHIIEKYNYSDSELDNRLNE